MHEAVPRKAGYRLKVFQVSCVRQLIDIDNVWWFRFGQQQSDKSRADKAGAARHQDFHQKFTTASAALDFRCDCATRFPARSRDSKVPASVHHPFSQEKLIVFSRM